MTPPPPNAIVIDLTGEPDDILISIDIGVRNCAYALLNESTMFLLEWKRFNLFPDVVETIKKVDANATALSVSEHVSYLAQKHHFSSRNVRCVIEYQMPHQAAYRGKYGNNTNAVTFNNNVIAACFATAFTMINVSLLRGSALMIKNKFKLSSGAQKKRDAVKYVSEWIKPNIKKNLHIPQNLLDIYNNERKKDDMADTMLQLIFYSSKPLQEQ